MGTRRENDEAHKIALANMSAQLEVWSTQLDDLIASSIKAGALPNDPHRVRVDDLRTLHGAVHARVQEFEAPSNDGRQWGSFRADIADDWKVLKKGVEDLTH